MTALARGDTTLGQWMITDGASTAKRIADAACPTGAARQLQFLDYYGERDFAKWRSIARNYFGKSNITTPL